MGNGASVGLSGLIGEDEVDDCEHPGELGLRRARVARATSDGHNTTATTVSAGHQQQYHGSRRASTLAIVSELQKQVRDRDALLERCAAELRDLRQQLASKDAELSRLKAEVNKFQSVLDAKSPVPGAGPLGVRIKSDLLATINEEALMMGQESRQKKQGVSGESAQTGHGVQEIKHFDKDFKYGTITVTRLTDYHCVFVFLCRGGSRFLEWGHLGHNFKRGTYKAHFNYPSRPKYRSNFH